MTQLLWTRETQGGDCYDRLAKQLTLLPCPCYTIAYDVMDQDLLSALHGADFIIVMSAHALHDLPTTLRARFYAIGARTQQALQDKGYPSTIPTHANSQGLIALLSQQIMPTEKGIILCGHQGHRTLYHHLQTQTTIRECCRYRRLIPTDLCHQLQQHAPHATHCLVTCCTSVRALTQEETYLTLLQTKPLLCLSQRIADFAKTVGFEDRRVFHQMTPSAILQNL